MSRSLHLSWPISAAKLSSILSALTDQARILFSIRKVAKNGNLGYRGDNLNLEDNVAMEIGTHPDVDVVRAFDNVRLAGKDGLRRDLH